MTIPSAPAKIIDDKGKLPPVPSAPQGTDSDAVPFAQALQVYDDVPPAASNDEDARTRNSLFRAGEYLADNAGVSDDQRRMSASRNKCINTAVVIACLAVGIGVAIGLSLVRKNGRGGSSASHHSHQLGSPIQGSLSFDESGWAIDLNENATMVAVGAPALHENAESRIGSVRVFTRGDDNDWQQLGNTIQGQTTQDEAFGSSLALSSDGSTLVIGDYLSDDTTNLTLTGTDSGTVRVFRMNEGKSKWVQAGQDLNGLQADDWAGRSVAVSADGNLVAVGAVETNPQVRAGYVQILAWNATASAWQQHGSVLRGEEEDGFSFGFDVDLSADGAILAVGDYRHSSEASGNNAGQVQVYEWSDADEDWGLLDAIYGQESSDWFGWSLSLSPDGEFLAVGATQSSVRKGGYVRVYKRNDREWEKVGTDLISISNRETFGHDVAMSSTGVLVTSDHRYSAAKGDNTGRVQTWKRVGAEWASMAEVDGIREGDFFGRSVSISVDGSIFASGAPGNDDNGLGSGHVRVFEV